MVLGEKLSTRDNNLNLIRILAAISVLVSHAWPISLGEGIDEPLERLTGNSLGWHAVLVFFSASGFLITASYMSGRGICAFMIARFARLFPGLAASLIVVALIIGPIVTDLPLRAYLYDLDTWHFLVRNIALVWPQYTLPGVFETNPYQAIEGSIWTLSYEVACYSGVALIGLTGVLARRDLASGVLVIWLALTLLPSVAGLSTNARIINILALSQPFAFGAGAWLWRDRLSVSLWTSCALLALAVLTASTALADLVLALALTHLTLALAVMRLGPLSAYARAGDYSYGLYIYAFPVQGLIVWVWGGEMDPMLNIALSLPLTLAFAIPSWHLVERPALRRFVRRPEVARDSAEIPAASSAR